MNDQTTVIEIPVPSDEVVRAAGPDVEIEVEDLSQKPGHFAVDYRRC